MSDANEKQVGGTHYANAMQHWDFVASNELNYFEGQITKYVARCRKKNGIEDLQKAMHFTQKYIELAHAGAYPMKGAGVSGGKQVPIVAPVKPAPGTGPAASQAENAQQVLLNPVARLRQMVAANQLVPTMVLAYQHFTFEGVHGNKMMHRCKLCKMMVYHEVHNTPYRVHMCDELENVLLNPTPPAYTRLIEIADVEATSAYTNQGDKKENQQ